MIQKTLDEFLVKTSSDEAFKKNNQKNKHSTTSKDDCSFRSFHKNVLYFSHLYRDLLCRVLYRSQNIGSNKDLSFRLSNSSPIFGFSFDHRSEYSLVHREMEMTLFSISNDLCNSGKIENIVSGIVNLHTSKMSCFSSSVRGCVSDVQFNGKSLCVSCAVKPNPLVLTFDLETVDEDKIDPLTVFDLHHLMNYVNNISPRAHVLTHYSEFVNVAGLSNGKTVYLDTRAGKIAQCTEYKQFTGYTLGSAIVGTSPITALSVNSNNSSQLLCGSRSGNLFLWDLRYTQQPVAAVCAGTFEISKILFLPCWSSRVGCSRILCSSAAGSLFEYNMGNTLMKIWEFSCGNIARLFSERLPPRVDLHTMFPLVLFSNTLPNCVSVFDLDSCSQNGIQTQSLIENKFRTEPQTVASLSLPHESVTCVKWVPNREKILVGFSDGEVHVVDLGSALIS